MVNWVHMKDFDHEIYYDDISKYLEGRHHLVYKLIASCFASSTMSFLSPLSHKVHAIFYSVPTTLVTCMSQKRVGRLALKVQRVVVQRIRSSHHHPNRQE
jgi:hypothetical protein